MLKCSATGPSVITGKKVRAAKITTTNTKITEKLMPSVCNVPMDSLTNFFFTRDPAIASCKTIDMYLPNNITSPVVIFQNTVLSDRP